MMSERSYSAKRVAIYGVLVALAIVFGYVEHLIPLPIGIYGIKLGLSNIVTVVTLYLLGSIPALCLNVLRVLLSSLLFGNAFSLAYSLCGGIVSVIVMIITKKLPSIGITGVSIAGGVTHNLAQLAVAVLLFDELRLAFYLPVLLAAGAITGFLIGVVALPIINSKNIKDLFKKTKTKKGI